MRIPWVLSVVLLFSATFGYADCAKDNRSDKKSGILIADFTITGSQTLSSTEIAEITGQLIGSCFNEDLEEIGERIRALYQDRGYFAAEVKSVHIKPADPLGAPKPALLEAEVAEGPQYKVAEITFLENHAFSSERLRQAFPLKKGALFERGRVAGGLESVRKLYATSGYLDVIFIPDTRPSSDTTMSLTVSMVEGTQYHMGKLDILAKKELSAWLRTQWELTEGSPYDASYIDTYIEANRDKLPADFTRGSVQVVRNCPDASVAVTLLIDPEGESKVHSQPHDVPCEEKDKPK